MNHLRLRRFSDNVDSRAIETGHLAVLGDLGVALSRDDE